MNGVGNSELYRYKADTNWLGLTVVEAMICDLPTFATSHGGPADIVVYEKSGFPH